MKAPIRLLPCVNGQAQELLIPHRASGFGYLLVLATLGYTVNCA